MKYSIDDNYFYLEKTVSDKMIMKLAHPFAFVFKTLARDFVAVNPRSVVKDKDYPL